MWHSKRFEGAGGEVEEAACSSCSAGCTRPRPTLLDPMCGCQIGTKHPIMHVEWTSCILLDAPIHASTLAAMGAGIGYPEPSCCIRGKYLDRRSRPPCCITGNIGIGDPETPCCITGKYWDSRSRSTPPLHHREILELTLYRLASTKSTGSSGLVLVLHLIDTGGFPFGMGKASCCAAQVMPHPSCAVPCCAVPCCAVLCRA
jgi:hypothetical protein